MPGRLAEPQQIRKAGQRAARLQKVVRQQLAGAGAALDVDAQAHGQKRLEVLGDLVGLLEARRAVGGDEVERLERLLVQVRWLRLNHFNGHDAERPNVDLGAVRLLLHHLRRHPVRRADHRRALALRLGELGAEAKVGCKRNGICPKSVLRRHGPTF